MIDDHEFKIAVAAAIARHDTMLAQLAETVQTLARASKKIGDRLFEVEALLSRTGCEPAQPPQSEIKKPN